MPCTHSLLLILAMGNWVSANLLGPSPKIFPVRSPVFDPKDTAKLQIVQYFFAGSNEQDGVRGSCDGLVHAIQLSGGVIHYGIARAYGRLCSRWSYKHPAIRALISTGSSVFLLAAFHQNLSP